MTESIEKSLLDLDFDALTRRTFTPSPAAWEDQVLYFLLLVRFSDSKEKGGYRDNEGRPVNAGVTPLYRPEEPGRVDYDAWLGAGNGWQGGTLQGLKSKLGYLKRLGVTALWVSPVFRAQPPGTRAGIRPETVASAPAPRRATRGLRCRSRVLSH